MMMMSSITNTIILRLALGVDILLFDFLPCLKAGLSDAIAKLRYIQTYAELISIRVLIYKSGEESKDYYPQVKEEAPVLDIIDIVLDSLSDGRITP